MTFCEAMQHVLDGETVTDGFLQYRLGKDFLECKQGYLPFKAQCPYWTRKQLESTRWKVVHEPAQEQIRDKAPQDVQALRQTICDGIPAPSVLQQRLPEGERANQAPDGSGT